MTPNIRKTILEDPLCAAIELLAEYADFLLDCYASEGGDWSAEPEAKADYDRILAVAAGLEKLRKGSTKDNIGIPMSQSNHALSSEARCCAQCGAG